MNRLLAIALVAVLSASGPATAADPALEKQAEQAFGDKWPTIRRLLDEQRDKALAEILAVQNGEPRAALETVNAPPAQAPGNWTSISLGSAGNSVSDSQAERASILANARARTASPLEASVPRDDTIRHEASVLTPAALENAAGVAPANRSARGDQSAFQLDTSADAATASVNIVIPGRRHYDGVRIIDQALSIKTSAPIKKGSDYAPFASLDGAATGLSVGVDWVQTSARPFTFGGSLAAFCARIGLPDTECYSNRIEDLLREARHSSLRPEWDSLVREFGWARVYRIGANVTQNKYDYFTSLTTKQSDREQQWTAGASFGLTSPSRRTYIGGGFDVGRKFKEAKDRIVCPLSTTDTFDCVLGKFSAPTRYYSRTAHVELRSEGLGRPFSLRLDHDFASDKSSADLPIYLLRDKKSKFTGGLRLGWTSDDDFIAGIFVGKEFGIEPGK